MQDAEWLSGLVVLQMNTYNPHQRFTLAAAHCSHGCQTSREIWPNLATLSPTHLPDRRWSGERRLLPLHPPTCVWSRLWLSSSSAMRAELSVSMACCCCRDSWSCRLCWVEVSHSSLAPWSSSCRPEIWGRGQVTGSERTLEGFSFGCGLCVDLSLTHTHTHTHTHT